MDPAWIGIIVLGLSQLVTLGVGIRKLSGRAETRTLLPDPLRVTTSRCDDRHREIERRMSALETAQSRQSDAVASQIGRLGDSLKAELCDLRTIQIESSRGTHARLNALVDVVAAQGREVSELKGRVIKS